MKISFKSNYKSIEHFDEVNAPDFVVLTGVNGSGKSHLLEAINSNAVVINDSNARKIVWFNFENFRLENEGNNNSQAIYQEVNQAWSFFQVAKVNFGKQLIGDTYEKLTEKCQVENIPLWDCIELPDEYKQRVIDNFSIGNYPNAIGVLAMIKMLPYSIDEVTEEDFKFRYKPFATQQDFLPATIGKIIWDYHVKYQKNKYLNYCNIHNTVKLRTVTESDFFKIQREKPWEVFNKIIESFKTLNYRINSPEGMDIYDTFALTLIHTENPNLRIDFQSLSSGERVLMALVASIYKSTSDQYFPDVLLLDEVDSSLHPSMIENMLHVIQSVFLKNNMKVILVTHSPTTIALCPEESIYVMNRGGSNRIEKKDRRAALSILTEGFATLEEGMLLFDQIADNKVNIITEGYNTKYLRKALELEKLEDKVKIIEGFESITSKDQLKILFDFFSCATHQNIVLFVWDCDATNIVKKLQDKNNTYKFIFPNNTDNKYIKNGIENLFPNYLFNPYLKTIQKSQDAVEEIFDKTQKRYFESHVLESSKVEDFSKFQPFINKVRELSKL